MRELKKNSIFKEEKIGLDFYSGLMYYRCRRKICCTQRLLRQQRPGMVTRKELPSKGVFGIFGYKGSRETWGPFLFIFSDLRSIIHWGVA